MKDVAEGIMKEACAEVRSLSTGVPKRMIVLLWSRMEWGAGGSGKRFGRSMNKNKTRYTE